MYGSRWCLTAISALLGCLGTATARSATGDRVMVVLEPQVAKDDYSKFWASLEGRGFDLTFKGPKDESAVLNRYGEALYDHLIMFTPSTKSYSTGLSPKEIVSAQLSGLNTLFLLSPNISELNRDTMREYDLEVAERDFVYLDAFAHAASGLATPLLQPGSCLVENGAVLSKDTLTGGRNSIVFPSGTSFTLGQNPYLVEVARGSKTGYVGENRVIDPDEAEVEAGLGKKDAALPVGQKAVLVAAMQTRDNVRIGFVGSGAMLSDEWWGTDVMLPGKKMGVFSGNAGFAEDFTKWVFQETGVVKVISTAHHRKGEDSPKEIYRIKDDLTFSISLAEHITTSNTSTWKPFTAPDLQVEFTMLDPHIRTALSRDTALSDSAQTTYTTTFRAPDRHGVFKFVVDYWRPGWSYISTSDTASVMPYRHDEYPRFIGGAWPFYSSAISMSIAFLLFCGLWVVVGEGDRKGKKKAE